MRGYLLIALLCATLTACSSPSLGKKQDYDKEDGPRLAEFNYKLAGKFYIQNRPDLAFRYLNTAVSHDPNNGVFRLAILDLYLSNRDADSALQYMEACPEEMKETPEFLKRRALAYEINDKSKEAGELLNKLPNFMAAARNRLINQQGDEAMILLEKELAKYPSNTDLLNIISDLCHVIGAFDNEARYRMRCAKLSMDKEEQLRAAAHAYVLANNIYQGMQEFSVLDSNGPGMTPGLNDACLGYLAYRASKHKEAKVYFENAFENSAFSPTTREILAFAEIRMRSNQHSQAIDLLAPLVNRNPSHGLARAALALAYLNNQQKDLAVEVVKNTPKACDNQGYLEAIHRKLGREEHENQ